MRILTRTFRIAARVLRRQAKKIVAELLAIGKWNGPE
jgi:hypothetical protein